MTLGSLLLPQLPFPSSTKPKRRGHSMQICAVKRDRGRDEDRYQYGKVVDENMIVLRGRIHEMKAAEERDEPPSSWMDWEKRYYPDYGSDVCEAVGLLQILLMNTRPSLALGFVVLLALCVPTSVATVFCHMLDIAKNFG